MLEDSIPIRPTGFCNVNQLFEVPTELAQSVEVLRGPANALYGSNGLHGTINFPDARARDDAAAGISAVKSARTNSIAANSVGADHSEKTT